MKKIGFIIILFIFTGFIFASQLKKRYDENYNFIGYSRADFLKNDKELVENEQYRQEFAIKLISWAMSGYTLDYIEKLTKQQKSLLKQAFNDWDTELGDFYEIQIQEPGEERMIVFAYFISPNKYDYEAYYMIEIKSEGE